MEDGLSGATANPAQSFMRGTRENIRKQFGMQTPEEEREEQLVNESNTIWNYLATSRRKAEWEWWLNDQFYQGEQYVGFNFTTQKVERTAGGNDSRLIINKINQNARNVMTKLNKEHPQSKVLPGVEDDGAYVRAKKEEHLLDYWYDCLEMNKKCKQITLDAYKYKFGWAKILWNQDALAPTTPYDDSENGAKSTKSKGEVMFERVDPWEVYFDPLAKNDVDSMRYIMHVVPRTIGELKHNKLYKNTDKIASDSKLAASFLKEAQIRSQTVGASQFAPAGAGNDYATVLVRELFKREWDSENTKWIIRVITTTQHGVLLRDQVWPMDSYPFELYMADVQGNLLDGGGPIRHLRSPQKGLNQMMTIIQENARVMGKINWRIPRGSNVNVITDEVGQFLEYDPTPGGLPEQIQPAGLPAYMPNHINKLEGFIDDLGGNHSASYGRNPGSQASGELVNKLQEGDSNNLDLMRDNLDDFYVRVYKKMLLTFKKNGKVDRQIRSKVPNAIGDYTFTGIKPEEVAVEDTIMVKTGSNLPYSLNDRQQLFLDLYKEKAIDNTTLLKALEMPDLDNEAGSKALDIERAVEENRDLLKGKPVIDTTKGEDQAAHMQAHTQLIRSPLFKQASTKVQDAIMKHYESHIDMNYKLTMIAASLNVDTIKRSEAIMYRPNNFSEMTPIERTQIFSKFGVQSDAGEIQARGGLAVTDPAMAEQQAQAEDIQMMDGTPTQISIGDNHQVHIQTHSQITESAAWDNVPEVIKTIITTHIKQHMTALRSQTVTPGLVPAPNNDIPSHAQIIKPAPKGDLKDAKAQGLVPVNQAAEKPETALPRTLSPIEMIQHKGAVKNKLASEKLQAQVKAKKAKPKKKSKLGA